MHHNEIQYINKHFTNEQILEYLKIEYEHLDLLYLYDQVKQYCNLVAKSYPTYELQFTVRKDSIFNISIVIEIGDFVISNTHFNDLHKIKDMYMKLNFKVNNYIDNEYVKNSHVDLYSDDQLIKKFILYNIEGVRSTLTENELSVGYIHSHLGSSPRTQYDNTPFYFSQFCLGSGALYMAQQMFNASSVSNENLFTLIVLQIEPYLEWESLEGGPHIKLDRVIPKDKLFTFNIEYDELLNYYDLIDKTLNPKDLELTIGYDTKFIKTDAFLAYVDSIMDSKYRVFVSADGTEYEMQKVKNNYKEVVTQLKSNFIFKGVSTRPLKVLLGDGGWITNKQYSISKDLIAITLEYLNNKLKLQLLKHD